MGNVLGIDHEAKPATVRRDGNRYETLNAESLGCTPRSFPQQHPSAFTGSDYRRWINATSLDPVEDFLCLRHSVCRGMLDVVSILYVPIRSCAAGDVTFGGVQFYDRIYRDLEGEELLPSHLSFISGLVISQRALPTDQRSRDNYVWALRQRLAEQGKKMLQDAAKNPEVWRAVWENFGWYIKLGACYGTSDQSGPGPGSMASLLRYRTSLHPGRGASLDRYVARMRDGQDKIFFARGRSLAAIRSNNPVVERAVAAGLEVLFMTDPLDDFVVSSLKEFAGLPFHSVTEFDDSLDRAEAEGGRYGEEEHTVAAAMRDVLRGRVRDVRVHRSGGLRGHPCCLITRGAKATRTPLSQEVIGTRHAKVKLFQPERDLLLDINPDDPIVRALQEGLSGKGRVVNRGLFKEITASLYKAALLASGFSVGDGAEYQQDTLNLMKSLGVI